MSSRMHVDLIDRHHQHAPVFHRYGNELSLLLHLVPGALQRRCKTSSGMAGGTLRSQASSMFGRSTAGT